MFFTAPNMLHAGWKLNFKIKVTKNRHCIRKKSNEGEKAELRSKTQNKNEPPACVADHVVLERTIAKRISWTGERALCLLDVTATVAWQQKVLCVELSGLHRKRSTFPRAPCPVWPSDDESPSCIIDGEGPRRHLRNFDIPAKTRAHVLSGRSHVRSQAGNPFRSFSGRLSICVSVAQGW